MANGPIWTTKDKAALRSMAAAGNTLQQSAEALGRSKSAVKTECQLTGIRHRKAGAWSDDDIEALRRLWPTKTWRKVSQALSIKRAETAINNMAYKLGLVKDAPIPFWSEADVRILRERWATCPASAIAPDLEGKRSVASIEQKARLEGLGKDVSYLISIGRFYALYPLELRSAMSTIKALKKELKNAKKC